MFGLILAWKERIARVQLSHDTAKAPHIDRRGVRDTQDDLWRAVETTLDVRVDALILEAGGTIVNNFDTGLVGLLK